MEYKGYVSGCELTILLKVYIVRSELNILQKLDQYRAGSVESTWRGFLGRNIFNIGTIPKGEDALQRADED